MDKVILKEQCKTTTYFKRLQQYDYGNGSYLLRVLSICLLYVLITLSNAFKNLDATHHVKEANSFPGTHFMFARQSYGLN